MLTVSGPGIAPVVLRPDGRGGWGSPDPRWRPAHALADGPVRVVLDDGDPYRAVDNDLRRHGLFAFGTLTSGQRDHWRATWRAALPMLALAGQCPLVESGLLGCVVPMTRPPGVTGRAEGAAHSSGTRREAFGAVLASAPSGPATLAATLVHELHHAKLSAVSDLTPLHTAGPPRRYWAPWRPDARPFDGLLQGAYAHLALADYWQRVALAPVDAELRDLAWAEHARCREQVGAILPTLTGSRQLTFAGRVLLTELAALHARMKADPPPARYLARATAYVETARLTWRRQHTR
ncbi:aKG-HExxH-type peptide beta-hydroxylase [Streptomyces sp. NPDC057676]|uniref:aKG-HExxH-type peptide beta-hydroxylase n=1 Tax=Streptomyces sp. NPDC057676 TaxID=3346205 RepID=UPI00367EE984